MLVSEEEPDAPEFQELQIHPKGDDGCVEVDYFLE
jgi:hypothetical protein